MISVPNLPTNVAYANGYLVFVRAGTLYAQPFDPIRLAFNGEPAAIAEQVAHDAGTGALFSVSTNGVLVYRSQAASVRTQLTWIDRTGRTVGPIGSVTSQDSPVLSQDETHIALIRPSDIPNSDDVWLINLASGASSRLTFDGGSYSPVWSPDGRYIAFGTQRHLTNSVIDAVFRKAAAGTGDAELLFRGRFTTYPSDWSRNGQFIIYVERDRATKNDLWALPLDAERKPIPLVRTNGDDALGRLSPDGRWLAAASDVSGREEVYVQTFPVPHGKWQISISGGTQPRWRRDAKELYYVAANGQLLGVAVRTEGAEFESGVQQRLFVLPPSHGEDSIYDVSADGSRFLVNSVVSDTSQPIVVTLNWTAGLKK